MDKLEEEKSKSNAGNMRYDWEKGKRERHEHRANGFKPFTALKM